MPSTLQRLLVDLAIGLGLCIALGGVFLFDRLAPKSKVALQNAKANRTGDLFSSGSIYALRTQENREEWITEFGGSVISEKSVNDGLDWLARHQAKDGCWSNRYLGGGNGTVCEEQEPCRGPGQDYAMAQTGLSLLAFQAGGHYHFNKKKYSPAVRRGLDWLVENQQKDGGLHSGRSQHYMYEHGIAAFALCEACAVSVAASQATSQAVDKRYLLAAQRAVAFLEDQQHADGGWRYTDNRRNPSDASISGWQVLALKSAKEAQIPVSKDCIAGATRFFKSCETGVNGRTSYMASGQFVTEATTGVGMLVHQFFLNTPDSPLIKEAAPYLADMAENRWGASRNVDYADYYLWYNCTLAMFQAGGENWERWNSAVRDTIIRLQEKSDAGCARGSWPPNSQHGGVGGRIYTTALAVLTLEVYYRFTAAPKVRKVKVVKKS